MPEAVEDKKTKKAYIREDFSMTPNERLFYRWIVVPLVRTFFGLGRILGLIQIYYEGEIAFPVNTKQRVIQAIRSQIKDLINKNKVFIVASNHENRVHTVIAAWVTDRLGIFTRKIVKDSYYQNKYFAKLLYAVGDFPVDIKKPRKALLYSIKEVLKKGNHLLIFPEGTRGGSVVFEGASFIAWNVKDSAYLLPMRIIKDGWVTKIFILSPLEVMSFAKDSEDRQEFQGRVTEFLANFFEKRMHKNG